MEDLIHISHACFIVEAETVGSQTEELTRPLVDAFHVKTVAVCQVIPRGLSSGKNFEEAQWTEGLHNPVEQPSRKCGYVI